MCELWGRAIGHMWITVILDKHTRAKMPILLFLLDTSASMNQRTYLGTTYLDIAKGAVEVFMKVKNDLTPTFFSQRAPLQSLGSSARLVGINICCFGFLLFLTAACPRPG